MSKLYTEQQVKQMIDDAHNGIDGYYDIFKKHIAIQLPTDEEIEEISKYEILYNNSKKSWWLDGAKWMRDKIKGGDNE